MKNFRVLSLTAVLILFLTASSSLPASTQELSRIDRSCSCEAPDGSCSASITCTNGCEKFCGPNGNCYVYCSGVFGALSQEVTLEVENSTYPRLVNELSRVSGVDLEFIPLEPDTVFNAGYKRAVLWGALDSLNENGTVRVAGQDFQRIKRLRRLLLSNKKFSFGVRGTPLKTFVADLASLTGMKLSLTSGDPDMVVTVELEEASLHEIIDGVSKRTGATIDPGDAGRGGR